MHKEGKEGMDLEAREEAPIEEEAHTAVLPENATIPFSTNAIAGMRI